MSCPNCHHLYAKYYVMRKTKTRLLRDVVARVSGVRPQTPRTKARQGREKERERERVKPDNDKKRKLFGNETSQTVTHLKKLR